MANYRSILLAGSIVLLATPGIAVEPEVKTLSEWQKPATTVQEWRSQIQAQQPESEQELEEEIVITGDQQPSGYRAPNASDRKSVV